MSGCNRFIHFRNSVSFLTALLLAFFSFVAVAGAQSAGDWSMSQGGPDHTGRSGNTGPTSAVYAKWIFDTHVDGSVPVMAADGTIYVTSPIYSGGTGALHAINPDGTEKWRLDLDIWVNQRNMAPALDSRGNIYLGVWSTRLPQMHLYSIDPSGSVRWSSEAGFGGWPPRPIIDENDRMYLAWGTDVGSQVTAYDITSDATAPIQLWKFTYQGGSKQFVNFTLAVKDGTVFVQSDRYFGAQGDVFALDASTGTKKWSHSAKTSPGPITVDDNGSIFNKDCQDSNSDTFCDDLTGDGKQDIWLQAIDASGSLLWRRTMPITADVAAGSPALSQDGSALFHVTGAGAAAKYMEKVDAATGALIWNVQLMSRGYMYDPNPIVGADGTVYVVTSNGAGTNPDSIIALDPGDGHFLWKYRLSTYSDIPVIGADGTIYLGDDRLYALAEIAQANRAPELTVDTPLVEIDEGSTITNSGSFSDPDGDPVTLAASVGTVVDNGDGSWSWSYTPADGPTSNTVVITASDGEGEYSASIFLLVNNVVPQVGVINVPASPVPVGGSASVSSDFTDAGILDTHTASWSWGDGSTSSGQVTESAGDGTVTGSHIYSSPGVYTVALTVTDKDGGTGSSTAQTYIVVYDASAGFVTGGGWIDSPVGALTGNSSVTGKATFGFVSRYQRGATTPTGSTDFHFAAGDIMFKSSSYDWLVISGAKAQYKGTGTIKGSGNYGFILTAIDGALSGSSSGDLFRVKIWEKTSGAIIYDNKSGESDAADPTTALSGGSIVIHK